MFLKYLLSRKFAPSLVDLLRGIGEADKQHTTLMMAMLFIHHTAETQYFFYK